MDFEIIINEGELGGEEEGKNSEEEGERGEWYEAQEGCPLKNLTGFMLEYHLKRQVRYLKKELGRVRVERNFLRRELRGRDEEWK